MNHAELVKRYKAGKTSGEASHMFIEGDVAYSYGHHFPLVIRLTDGKYLVNGDKRSVTTTQHTGHFFSFGPQIPFSALNQAMSHVNKESNRFTGDMKDIRILDTRPSTYTWHCNCGQGHINYYDGCEDGYNTHVLGATLIEYAGKCILSTIDETQKTGAYSLIVLKKNVNTIDEALLELMPELVQKLTATQLSPERITKTYKVAKNNFCWQCRNGKPCKGHETRRYTRGVYANGVRRQGELWFVPEILIGEGLDEVEHNKSIPFNTTNHYASTLLKFNNKIYVTGSVKHSRGEHYTVVLKGWHRVLENTAEISFSASGRVD